MESESSRQLRALNGNGKEKKEASRFLGLTKAGFFGIAVIWIIISTTFFIVWAIRRDAKLTSQDAKLIALVKEGRQSHVALCALKTNLEGRAQDQQSALTRSKRFFATHPNAFPGVPVSLIHQGQDAQQTAINGQHQTIALLDRTLSCGVGADKEK